jgi:glyoxylase-like metal-dependent hydrolase (beta-lactamase superfamily II)
MILEVRASAPFYKNGFVAGCERTREAVLIDPGDEVDELLAAVRDLDVDVQAILLTHAHVDHITGVAAAKDAFEVPVYLHRDDLFLYEAVVQQGAMFGFKVRPQPPIDVYYDLTPVHFGDYEVRVHHTPGHCPGGVCLQVGEKGTPGKHLFVGDTLFAGAIGRTDLPGGDYALLMRSIT